MRWGLAHTAGLITAWLLANEGSIHAQQSEANPLPQIESDASCPSPQQPPGREISIAGVSFSGALQMAVADQDRIADSVKQETTRGASLDDVREEALERVRARWQNHGYFKVQVNGEGKELSSSSASQNIVLFVTVHEGAQYKLSGITFENNKAISNVKALRRLFPISDGDILSAERMRKGLESLREAYGQLGYINFVAVPRIAYDDENGLISLDIDMQEGKPFYVSSVNVQGLNEPDRLEILKDAPVGQIYNAKTFELFLKKHSSMLQFSSDDPWHVKKRLDEQAGTVAITLDAYPCPVH